MQKSTPNSSISESQQLSPEQMLSASQEMLQAVERIRDQMAQGETGLAYGTWESYNAQALWEDKPLIPPIEGVIPQDLKNFSTAKTER